MITITLDSAKIYALKSTQLLIKCKKIFGNIVESAYILNPYTISPDDSESVTSKDLKRVNKELCQRENLDYDKYLEYGGTKILLKFVSGKFVLFDSSEWASFKNIEEVSIK